MQSTIKARVTQGLVFIFIVILLLSGVGGYYLYQVSRSPEATFHDNYRSVAYAQYMATALADLHAAHQRPTSDLPTGAARQLFANNIAAEQRNITEPGEGPLADSLAVGFRQYVALAPASAAEPALYQQLRRQVARVAALNLKAIELQSQRTQQLGSRIIAVLALLAAVGILAVFSFIFTFPAYVTRPLDELTAGIRRLAAGDYSQRLPVPAHQEFVALAQSFNDMARKLDDYETADGTPHLGTRGALSIVTEHRQPGTPAISPAAPDTQQRQLVQRLHEQAQQLLNTSTALLTTHDPAN